MITETKGNLLEAKTETLVNAVNCVGVMGKGIALQFRREFSEDYFKDYKRACQSGELAIGKVWVYSLSFDSAFADELDSTQV
jgi:O-acetyl-ADP-ribose deacetylase (regulator of RNase III)